jgi:hypothetical protein
MQNNKSGVTSLKCHDFRTKFHEDQWIFLKVIAGDGETRNTGECDDIPESPLLSIQHRLKATRVYTPWPDSGFPQ